MIWTLTFSNFLTKMSDFPEDIFLGINSLLTSYWFCGMTHLFNLFYHLVYSLHIEFSSFFSNPASVSSLQSDDSISSVCVLIRVVQIIVQ